MRLKNKNSLLSIVIILTLMIQLFVPFGSFADNDYSGDSGTTAGDAIVINDPVSDDSSTTPPETSNPVTSPSDDSNQNPPSDNNDVTPPTDVVTDISSGEEITETIPDEEINETPAIDNNLEFTPVDNETQTPPIDNSIITPSESDNTETPLVDGKTEDLPIDDTSLKPPVKEETETPHVDDKTETQQVEEGTETPTEDGALEGATVSEEELVLPPQYAEVKALYDLETSIDDDNDGITNVLEENGFIVKSGRVEEWNGDVTVNHYFTDPISWSTTGDPYSDKMKTTGLNMDNNVLKPAKTNPLVAAYPDVRVYMRGFDVIPIETISDKEGNTQQDQYSNAVAKKDEQSHTGSINVKTGGSFKLGTTGVEKTFTYEVALGYSGTRSFGTTSTITDTTSKSINWESATTKNSDKAAKLRFLMEYANVGTAPIKNVQVKFNVKLGNKIIATVSPNRWDEVAKATLLTTSVDESQQTYGPFIVSRNDTNEIYVTMDELRDIQLGAPITIEPVEIKGTVIRWNPSNSVWDEISEWNIYKSQIAAKTATLVFEGADGRSQMYKISANHDYYEPGTTLGDAIVNTIGGEMTDNGIEINGSPLSDEWSYYFSNLSNVTGQLDNLISKGKGLFDVELAAGETVVIHEPKDNPDPVINWVKYSTDYKRVYASVTPGDYGVNSVTAEVQINGEIKTITLTKPNNGVFYYNSSLFATGANSGYGGKVTVTDEKGIVVEKEIDPSEEKDGLNFVALSAPIDVLPENATLNSANGSYSHSLANFPDAEAFVVQVESDRWASEDITVNVGGTEAELGTATARPRKWKLKFTDRQGTEYVKEGTSTMLNVSDITTLGIPNDSLKTVELLGDPGYHLEFYEHGNYSGSQKSYYYYSSKINFVGSSLENKVSSMRMVYTGVAMDNNSSSDYYATSPRNASGGNLAFLEDQNTYRWTSFSGTSSTIINNIPDFGVPHDSTWMLYNHNNTTPMVMALYEHSNLGGQVRYMFLDPQGWYDLGSYNFSKKLSSFKASPINYTANVLGSNNSPVVSKTLVVPRNSNVLDINWNVVNGQRNLNGSPTNAHIRVKIVGYFTKENGSGFTPIENSSTKIIKAYNPTPTQIATGSSDAKAFVYQIKSKYISSDDVTVTLNGIPHHFGVSNGYLEDIKDISNSPISSDLVIVPAGSDPNVVRVEVALSDNKKINSSSQIELKLIGYFSPTSQLKFIPIDTNKLSSELDVVSENGNSTTYSFSRLIKENTKPKALLLNFETHTVSPIVTKTVNGVTIDMGTNNDILITDSQKNVRSLSVDHSSLGIVPNEVLGQSITVNSSNGNSNDDIEMLGYFH